MVHQNNQQPINRGAQYQLKTKEKDVDKEEENDDDDDEIEMPKEVMEELRNFPQDKDYLAFLPPIESRKFTTTLLQHEYSCIESDDTSRPSASELANLQVDIPPPANSDMSDEELATWSKCLDQLKIKLEYKQRQLVNLELLKSIGLPAWKQLQSEHQLVSSETTRQLVEDLNNSLRRK